MTGTRSAESAEDRYIMVAGRKLRIRVRGEGPPVLLINGLGCNVATWNALHESLDGLEVISFDAPGAGRSKTPLIPYRIGHIADVARDVLDAVGRDRADVLGYSFGGAVAQELAVRSPDRVRKLVLVSTSCGAGAVPGSLMALLAVSTPARQHGRVGYDLMMKMLDLAPAEQASEALKTQTPSWHREAPAPPRGYMLQMSAFMGFNSTPWLHRIGAPALVVSGAADRLVPMANSAILAAYLPHARLQLVDRWGHYVLQDRASGAGALVADFLSAQHHEDSSAWRSGLDLTRQSMNEYVRSAPRSAHPATLTNGLVRLVHPPRRGTD